MSSLVGGAVSADGFAPLGTMADAVMTKFEGPVHIYETGTWSINEQIHEATNWIHYYEIGFHTSNFKVIDDISDFGILRGIFVCTGYWINERTVGVHHDQIIISYPFFLSLKYKGFIKVYVFTELSIC